MSILLDDNEITSTEINHLIGESMVDGGDYLMRFARTLQNKVVEATGKKILIELQAIYSLPDGGMFHNKMGEFIEG